MFLGDGALAIMVLYTWFKPQFGHTDTSKVPNRADLIKGVLLGFAIGFYDGFTGPGTGSFLLFLFIRFFHFDFLRATACAKVVNFGTNFSTLFFLIPGGLIHYDIALPLGIAAILGSVVGVRIALRGGNQWIRRAGRHPAGETAPGNSALVLNNQAGFHMTDGKSAMVSCSLP